MCLIPSSLRCSDRASSLDTAHTTSAHPHNIMPSDEKKSESKTEKRYQDKTAEEKEKDRESDKKKEIKPLDEDDIALLKSYVSRRGQAGE